MNQSKYIYLLAGPSGSGKSSVARKITEWYGFKEVWSYTERPPRYAGEPGHIFVTPEEFDAAGPMCAFTLYNGYRYGVPQSEIDSSLLYVIDPAGIEYMKKPLCGKQGYCGDRDMGARRSEKGAHDFQRRRPCDGR